MKKLGIRTGITALLLVAALVITSVSCASDSSAFTPPTADDIDDAPMEVVAMEMWQDYKADPVAAAAKYGGQKLLFNSVRVDQMSFLGEGMDPELYVQEGIDPNIQQVKFHTEDLYHIINVRDGYIVKIVGLDEGLRFGYVNVRILWLECIDPPGGDPNPPSEY